jgi:hypothetical protein
VEDYLAGGEGGQRSPFHRLGTRARCLSSRDAILTRFAGSGADFLLGKHQGCRVDWWVTVWRVINRSWVDWWVGAGNSAL